MSSHLSNPFNEPMHYDKAEASRLSLTVGIAYAFGAILVLAAFVTGIFLLMTSDALAATVLVVTLLMLVAVVVLISKNRPRLLRLQAVKRSTSTIVDKLMRYGKSLPIDYSTTFGNEERGTLQATKHSEDGSSWELRAMAPTIGGDGALFFEGTVGLFYLRGIGKDAVSLPYSDDIVDMLDVMSALIESEANFKYIASDVASKTAAFELEKLVSGSSTEG